MIRTAPRLSTTICPQILRPRLRARRVHCSSVLPVRSMCCARSGGASPLSFRPNRREPNPTAAASISAGRISRTANRVLKRVRWRCPAQQPGKQFPPVGPIAASECTTRAGMSKAVATSNRIPAAVRRSGVDRDRTASWFPAHAALRLRGGFGGEGYFDQ
jgi:hypothetical protein